MTDPNEAPMGDPRLPSKWMPLGDGWRRFYGTGRLVRYYAQITRGSDNWLAHVTARSAYFDYTLAEFPCHTDNAFEAARFADALAAKNLPLGLFIPEDDPEGEAMERMLDALATLDPKGGDA